MSEILITNEGEIVKEEFFNREVAILGDTQILQPAVVNRFEYDREFAMSQITQQVCGKVENRIESDKNPHITIEGIASMDQLRLIKTIHHQNRLLLSSEVYNGPVKVQRATAEQTTDITHISVPGEGKRQLAFPFQIQLTVPAKSGDPTTNEENPDPTTVRGEAPILYNRSYDRLTRYD